MSADRYFTNKLSIEIDESDAETQLKIFLTKTLEKLRHTRFRYPSVYEGAAGSAFALFRLAISGEIGSTSRERVLKESFRIIEWCEQAYRKERRVNVTFATGIAGVLALKVVLSQHLKIDSKASVCALLSDISNVATEELDDGECEVLYGRCGYLQAILFVRRHLKDEAFGRTQACKVIRQVVRSGRRAAKATEVSSMPLYYEWYGKCYLGGAHGISGILQTLLSFPEAVDSALLLDVKDTLRVIFRDYTYPSGNVYPSTGSKHDRLVHWCHGAPSYILLLCKCVTIFDEPQRSDYLRRAKRLGNLVWSRGLLKKGVGLCHGISGNAYCFLTLYRATKESFWLKRARAFALFATRPEVLSKLENIPDVPCSLFNGLAGCAVFVADLLHPTTASFPGYEYDAAKGTREKDDDDDEEEEGGDADATAPVQLPSNKKRKERHI